MNKINLPQAAKLTSPNPVSLVCTQKPDGYIYFGGHVAFHDECGLQHARFLWKIVIVEDRIVYYNGCNSIEMEENSMNQKERRDKGLPYISDDAVFEEQKVCRRILQRLNTVDRSDFEEIGRIVKELFGKSENAFLNPPFYCDYGSHIEVGKNLFMNYNCMIIDVAKVTIGDNCMFAPNVAIYTAGHPVHPVTRNSLYEYGVEVTIGDNVWIGGNSVVLPGVHIGSNTVIGAGSVVTKDIPDWVIAAGNPCKVIREITEEDRKYYFKDREFDEAAWAEVVKYAKKVEK